MPGKLEPGIVKQSATTFKIDAAAHNMLKRFFPGQVSTVLREAMVEVCKKFNAYDADGTNRALRQRYLELSEALHKFQRDKDQASKVANARRRVEGLTEKQEARKQEKELKDALAHQQRAAALAELKKYPQIGSQQALKDQQKKWAAEREAGQRKGR